MDGKSFDNVGKRQQRRFSFGEPKVILEVPSPAEDINGVNDFESEIKKDVNRTVTLLSDGCHVRKWKRGRGNFRIGDPLQDPRQNKKLRLEHPIENPLDQISTDGTCSAVPTQSDVSKVHQLSILSNQTLGNSEGAHVVMVDKTIHVSEVTSEMIDAISVRNQESTNHLDNPTVGIDKFNLHGNKTDQSNSQIKEMDIPCGSSIFAKLEEICEGNNSGQVPEHL